MSATTARRGFSAFATLGRAILTNRKATAGAILLALCLFMALCPGLIAPGDPNAEVFQPGQGPTAANWPRHHLLRAGHLRPVHLGRARLADHRGRRRAALHGDLGAGRGRAAGYLGGTTDSLLSLVTDVFLVIPAFPLVVVIAAYSKTGGNAMIITVLVLTGWSYGARQLRAQVLSLRHREFLTPPACAASAAGASSSLRSCPT